jgi:DNA-binding NarL/FixJ family response regulator
VLVVARGGAPDLATTLPAGECVMLDGRDQDLPDLAAAIRAVVEGDCAPGVDVGQPEHGRARPRLSEREESVLRAYASGLTLDAAARQVGVRPSTAKTYLERVKEKYRQAGRPAYTKTELAQRVREDCPHC